MDGKKCECDLIFRIHIIAWEEANQSTYTRKPHGIDIVHTYIQDIELHTCTHRWYIAAQIQRYVLLAVDILPSVGMISSRNE